MNRKKHRCRGLFRGRSVRYQIFNSGFQFPEPAHFSAAHRSAPGRRVIIGAGQVVESVGDIKSQFSAASAMMRAFQNRPFYIDDQVAGGAFFAGHRFAAETDDIGRPVFTEKFAVILRNTGIVRQQQRDLLPDGFFIRCFELCSELSGQPAECGQIDPAFLPVYQCGFHL